MIGCWDGPASLPNVEQPFENHTGNYANRSSIPQRFRKSLKLVGLDFQTPRPQRACVENGAALRVFTCKQPICSCVADFFAGRRMQRQENAEA